VLTVAIAGRLRRNLVQTVSAQGTATTRTPEDRATAPGKALVKNAVEQTIETAEGTWTDPEDPRKMAETEIATGFPKTRIVGTEIAIGIARENAIEMTTRITKAGTVPQETKIIQDVDRTLTARGKEGGADQTTRPARKSRGVTRRAQTRSLAKLRQRELSVKLRERRRKKSRRNPSRLQ